jgi:carbon storage regulator
MLMMSRQAGETILIGDDIEIVIAHIGRSRVKVGIRAPRQIPVVAREVKLVRDQNQAAAKVSPAGLVELAEHFSGSSFSVPRR